MRSLQDGSVLAADIAYKPKLTPLWSLAARALGAHDPDPSVRNPDWLAEPFLGAVERELLDGNPVMAALDRDYRDASIDARTAVAYMLQRTRFVDEHLQRAVMANATQVVILGAGFDSRAYRFRNLLRRLRVFEVDDGPTQEYKRRRVQDVLGGPPPNVTYVPVDFSEQTLGRSLASCGYRADCVTCFIWVGVTMYLSEDTVRSTFRTLASSCVPGSRIIFDYWTTRHIEDGPRQHEWIRRRFEMAATWGEPVQFGIAEGTAPTWLSHVGLDLIEELPFHGQEAYRRYLTRKRVIRQRDRWWPEPSRAEHPGTWLAAALVPQSR